MGKRDSSTQPDARRMSKQPENESVAESDAAFETPEFVASATECTGLSPSAVLSEPEAEEYARLYSVHRQKPADMDGPAQPGTGPS